MRGRVGHGHEAGFSLVELIAVLGGVIDGVPVGVGEVGLAEELRLAAHEDAAVTGLPAAVNSNTEPPARPSTRSHAARQSPRSGSYSSSV